MDKLIDKMILTDDPFGAKAVSTNVDLTANAPEIEPITESLDFDQKIVNEKIKDELSETTDAGVFDYKQVGGLYEKTAAGRLPVTYGSKMDFVKETLGNITGTSKQPVFTNKGFPTPTLGQQQADFILDSSFADSSPYTTPQEDYTPYLEKELALNKLINRKDTERFISEYGPLEHTDDWYRNTVEDRFGLYSVEIDNFGNTVTNENEHISERSDSPTMVIDTWEPTPFEVHEYDRKLDKVAEHYYKSTNDYHPSDPRWEGSFEETLNAPDMKEFFDERKERFKTWFMDNLSTNNNELYNYMIKDSYFERMKNKGLNIPLGVFDLDEKAEEMFELSDNLEDDWTEDDYNTLFENAPSNIKVRYNLWFKGMGLESPYKTYVENSSYSPSQIQNDLKGLKNSTTGFDGVSGHKGYFEPGDQFVTLTGEPLKRIVKHLEHQIKIGDSILSENDIRERLYNLGPDVESGVQILGSDDWGGSLTIGHSLDEKTGEEYMFVYDLWDLKGLDMGPISPQDIAGFKPPQIYERFYVKRDKNGDFKEFEIRKSKDNADKNKIYDVGESNIHGKGVFAEHNLIKGQRVGTALITEDFISGVNDIERTDLGKFINHQDNKNVTQVKEGNQYVMYADKDIAAGEELTMDYRDTPWFIDKNVEGFNELS